MSIHPPNCIRTLLYPGHIWENELVHVHYRRIDGLYVISIPDSEGRGVQTVPGYRLITLKERINNGRLSKANQNTGEV